ncbi:MAG: hypothetical protein ABI315_06645 [Bacteroidia bacterium]
MKKSITSLFLFFLITVTANAQSSSNNDYKKIYDEAEIFFINENYIAALPLYKKLDSINKDNADINFKIGFSYLNSATYKTKAIPYLEFAVKNITKNYKQGDIQEKKAPLSTYYYLGKAYHLNYEFDKAIEFYKKYNDALGKGLKYMKEVKSTNHDIETCIYGKELIKSPKKVIVTNLGDGVNSIYPDYAPTVSLDEQTLIFTSRRKGGTTDLKLPNGEYFEDIYISNFDGKKWGKAASIGTKINTPAHEATVNLSADGQKLLIYKDTEGGNIYISELKGNEWGVPQSLNAPVNSPYWESHACLSADNQVLYFVSDRPGGYGGRDIYKCLHLPNGQWGIPQNLGDSINTQYDEDGVFIHPDGKQIFFSSKGHTSMGGFDIFTSVINDENGNWSKPVNYGYPINTPDDDIYLVTTMDGKRAYYSSDKEGGYGEKDIYMLTFPEYEPRDIAVLIGSIVNKTSQSIVNNKIFIINNSSKDTVRQLVANSNTGKFGTTLPIGEKYTVDYTVNDHKFYSDTIETKRGKGYVVINPLVEFNGDPVFAQKDASLAKVLDTLKTKGCEIQNLNFEIHFKYNRKEIDTHLKEYQAFINSFIACIKTNSKLIITIESSASTVPTRKFKSNEQLAQMRADDAQKQLIKTLRKKGIIESQLIFNTPFKSLVQGPEYSKDAISKKTEYEENQYIKIKIILN